MGHLDRCEATGKVCFTVAEAETKARHARRHGGPEYKGRPAQAYRCKTCGWSHFGRAEAVGAPRRRRKR